MFVGPLVPDGHSVLLEPTNVRFTAQEPQQLIGDGLEVNTLRRDQRKPLGEVVADLTAEHADGTGTGSVVFVDAVLSDIPQKVFIRGGNVSHNAPNGYKVCPSDTPTSCYYTAFADFFLEKCFNYILLMIYLPQERA